MFQLSQLASYVINQSKAKSNLRSVHVAQSTCNHHAKHTKTRGSGGLAP